MARSKSETLRRQARGKAKSALIWVVSFSGLALITGWIEGFGVATKMMVGVAGFFAVVWALEAVSARGITTDERRPDDAGRG